MSLGAALKAGGAGQQFWHREGNIHHNPASGHHPGTVILIKSMEYLPIPMGERSGKEKLHKYRQAIINDLKGQQASRQTHEVPLLS